MKKNMMKYMVMLSLIAFGLTINADFSPLSEKELFSNAEAVVGRPATPVSYAGVARRSPVGVNRVGNRGGPVNRVGRR